jgi:uncharacterized membrane protein YeaQ/YmgE (transglycosylase-associated protein family)
MNTTREQAMSILITIIVGFVAGLLARALKPGNDRMGSSSPR